MSNNSMYDETWMKEDIASELPEPYRSLASKIGMKNVIALADEFQGSAIYFPKLDSLIRLKRDATIMEEFRNGATYKELAKKYQITETWVRELTNKDPKQSGMVGQVDLFNSQSA